MGPLPFIIGGGLVALLVAASAKAKSSSTTKPSSGPTKPTGSSSSTTQSTASTPAVILGPGGTAPDYLSSVPYVIAMRVIQMSDPSLQQAQAVWLTDNGYPKTGEAVLKYSHGDITDLELRQIAQAEFKANATTATTVTTTKPKGTTELDRYESYLLAQGDDDTLYSYALTSTSIPLVTQAAARLAAAGDTRAAALTQHLADLTI